MKKPEYVFALVVAAFFLLSTPASADVLYDNGLVNGGPTDYWGIYYNYVISNSFTLAGTSTLRGVNLDLSIATGDTPYEVSWRITDSHWDTQTNEDHGTQAILTDVTKLCTGCKTINNSPGDTYSASFSLPDVVLGPGTHFLTLDWGHGVGPDLLADRPTYWDISSGPSQVWINGYNVETLYGSSEPTYSNSFQILGTSNESTTVPEPAVPAMFLSGLALVAGLACRKMRA